LKDVADGMHEARAALKMRDVRPTPRRVVLLEFVNSVR
jgi:hypothetical protein